MKIGKRQIVLASLILALGAAVYLNWQFSDNELMKTSTNSVIGQAQLVNNQTDKSISNGEKENTKDKKASQGNMSADEYFADARTKRQKAQDQMAEMAKDILKSAESDENAKSKALESATKLANIYQQQTNIEELIKSKGFSDCVVFIQNKECSVVLKKNEVKDETNLVIKDIVNGQSGIEVERIKITSV